MLKPDEEKKIREEEERARDEELFRADIRKSLPKLPILARLRSGVALSTLLTGLLLWLLTAGLLAAFSFYWEHRQDSQAENRRRSELKTEMEGRLLGVAGQITQDRFQLVFSYPPKREASLRKRLYDDIETFLSESPAQAPTNLFNTYPQYAQVSAIILARQVADFDRDYAPGFDALVCLNQFTKGWRVHTPNIFDSPEERAESYAGEAWKRCLTRLPKEWNSILAPPFTTEVVVYD